MSGVLNCLGYPLRASFSTQKPWRSAENFRTLKPGTAHATLRALAAADRFARSAKLSGAPHSLGANLARGPGRSSFRTAAVPTEASEQAEELTDFICDSPILAAASISEGAVRSNADEWLRLGRKICGVLGFSFDALGESERLRCYQYYLPVYMWLVEQLRAHREQQPGRPLVLGISAPQGCGKTTLVTCLQELMALEGLRAATISIDDFYLTHSALSEVSRRQEGNRLLKYRGNAASHDLELGTSTLRKLCEADGAVAVPRYDKSMHSGLGDRAPESEWPVVEGPLDVVLFEGWMLGFRPQPDEAVAAVDEDLVPVNRALRGYEDAWDSWINSWLVVRVDDPQCVYEWRLQAEKEMRATGKAAMSDEQVADFVSRFMPAYKAYLPALYGEGPTTSRPGSTLVIQVDERRSPVRDQPAPIT